MKFKLSLLFFFIVVNNTYSQTSLNSTIGAYNDLDWSFFSTGILYDRVPFKSLKDSSYSANPINFHPDSFGSNQVNAITFEKLYQDFALADRYQSKFDTSFSFEEERINWMAQGDVPIGIINVDYDYLLPGAISNHWISYDTATGKYFHPGDTLRFNDSIPTDSTLTSYLQIDSTFIRNKKIMLMVT